MYFQNLMTIALSGISVVLISSASGKFNGCQEYKTIARQQSGIHDDIDIVCRARQTGSTCNGLDCNGVVTYTLKPIGSLKIPVEKADFCLGFDFDQCKESVTIYIDVPKRKLRFNHTFSRSNAIDIPRMQFSVSLLKIQLVLKVSLKPIAGNGISMNVSVRVRVKIFSRVTWPDDPKTVLHNVILYPRCNAADKLTHHGVSRSTCHPMRSIIQPATLIPAMKVSPIYNPFYASTGKRCDPSSFTDMLKNCNLRTEVCHHTKVCICRRGYKLTNNISCTANELYTYGNVMYSCQCGLVYTSGITTAPSTEEKSSTNTVLIISISTVVGAVAMAIVITVIVMVLKRRQASQYRGRQLVLTTDDDDADNDII